MKSIEYCITEASTLFKIEWVIVDHARASCDHCVDTLLLANFLELATTFNPYMHVFAVCVGQVMLRLCL